MCCDGFRKCLSYDYYYKYEIYRKIENHQKEFIFVPRKDLLKSPWKNGILFVHSDQTPDDAWCRSALGKSPGYTSNNGNIETFGAQPGWQLLILVPAQ